MKNKEIGIIILITLGLIFAISSINIDDFSNDQENIDDSVEIRNEINLKSPKGAYTESFIHIDGSIADNWSVTVSDNLWCSGDGSWGNPYIIEDVTINAGGSGSGIFINNSKNVHFIIRNCEVTYAGSGAGESGIKLENTNNGILTNNNCSCNGRYGILLRNNCDNNTISGNIASNIGNNNQMYGITLSNNCNNNTISGNTASGNQFNGITLLTDCDDNTISGNTASNTTFNQNNGIYLYNSDNNTISGNNVNDNQFYGIYLYTDCNENTISGNTASNDVTSIQNDGIYLESNCDNNTISMNFIKNNIQYGIHITDTCENNLIYQNSLKGNGAWHARDDGMYNQWNNSIVGNYWDNHTSPDSGNDGIVDTPYTWITGTAGSNDSFPLALNPVHDGEKIHIDDTSVSAPNWSTTAKMVSWCTGSGSYSDPYLLEGLEIDGGGDYVSCILIGNSSVYFTIQSCKLYNSRSGLIDNLDAGIKLSYTNNGTITNNNCSNNGNGIILDTDCDNNTISGNTVNNNYRLYGIGLYNGCNDNTISGNTANENEDYGIWLYAFCDDNTISGNTVNNNTKYGIYLYENCDRNNVSGNTANNNSEYGIYLNTDCDDNTIWANIIANNTQYGVVILSSSLRNLFYQNAFIGNTLHAQDGTNTGDNYWNKTLIGNYWDNHTAPDSNKDGIVDIQYTWITGAANSVDNYPLAQSPVFIGERIHIDDTGVSALNWSSTAHVMLWCNGTGTYSDPYLLDGLEIDGKGTGNCILIGNSSVYFTIQFCKVFNSGNGQHEAGIKLRDTSNGTIINNSCSNNGYHGITLYNDCDNNTITGNTLNENAEDGMYLYQSDENIITGNIANENSQGLTIRYSDNNTISGNTANENKQGIYLYESVNNTVSGNNANENDLLRGIVLYKCDNNTVSGNIATENLRQGIYLYQSHNNKILGNTANNNTQSGIYLENDCDGNKILGNTANNNTDSGIFLFDDCNNNTISDNILYDNTEAIKISSSNYNYIIENTNIYNNTIGIYLEKSNNTDIIGNIASFNGDAGIYLEDSNYNSIHDNTAKNNTYGLHLEDSSYNCIYENTLVNNTYNYHETGICIGNGDCRLGPSAAAGDGGGGDDEDDAVEVTIPFGNYYILFAVFSIIVLVIFRKRQILHNSRK